MQIDKDDLAVPAAWKTYLVDSFKFLAIFYVTTFSMILLFLHYRDGLVLKIMLAIVYITILIFSVRRLIRKLPMPAIFIAAPTIPLLILIMVVSMIPLLKLVSFNY